MNRTLAVRPAWWVVVRRAALISLVVGTCLTAINQGDRLLLLDVRPELLWKIPLTYAVPFVVSTYSSLAAARDCTHAT